MKILRNTCSIALLIFVSFATQAAETGKTVMLTEVPKEVLEKNKVSPKEQKKFEAESAKAAAEFEAFAEAQKTKKSDSQ